MTEYTTTPSGTRIAYDRAGQGPPVLLIGGAMQFRAVDPGTRALVDELADRGLSAVHYDRPGRWESSASGPVSLATEVEAVSTLLSAVGGEAVLYGSSSGAAIALAAAAELPTPSRLVLWEPPRPFRRNPGRRGNGADAIGRRFRRP